MLINNFRIPDETGRFLGRGSCRNSATDKGPDKIQRQGEDNGGVVLTTDLVKRL